MTRYVKCPRSEPTDENRLAGLLLLDPFAYAVSWWRRLNVRVKWG